jgi:hypothetical protein
VARREAQGASARAVQRALRTLVGKQHFEAKSFVVELRVDGTLEAGKFRVQALWDPQEELTVIISKSKQPKPPPQPPPDDEDKTEEPALVRLFSLKLERRAAGGQVTSTETRPVFKAVDTLGRGKEVDLLLPDDLEVMYEADHARMD